MGWCSVGKHEHEGIVGCHPIERHHRSFSHRSVGAGAGPAEDEYTWPEPKGSFDDEELTQISVGAVARAYLVKPSVLNRLLVDKLGLDAGGIVDVQRYTAEGKLQRYKERYLRPSEIAWAHLLALRSRKRSMGRSGLPKTIKPPKRAEPTVDTSGMTAEEMWSQLGKSKILERADELALITKFPWTIHKIKH